MKKIRKKRRRQRSARRADLVLSPSDQKLYGDIADIDFGYTYNPALEIDATRWLELDETSRNFAVAQYHLRAAQPWGKSLRLHAMAHTAAEDQLLKDFAPTVNAMRRLQGAGLTRHDAIHAVANEIMDTMFNALNADAALDMDTELKTRLDILTAEAWLASAK